METKTSTEPRESLELVWQGERGQRLSSSASSRAPIRGRSLAWGSLATISLQGVEMALDAEFSQHANSTVGVVHNRQVLFILY